MCCAGLVSNSEFWSETLQNRRETAFTGSQLGVGDANKGASQDDSAVMKVLLEPSLSVVKGLCSVIDIQVEAHDQTLRVLRDWFGNRMLTNSLKLS